MKFFVASCGFDAGDCAPSPPHRDELPLRPTTSVHRRAVHSNRRLLLHHSRLLAATSRLPPMPSPSCLINRLLDKMLYKIAVCALIAATHGAPTLDAAATVPCATAARWRRVARLL